MHNTLESPMLSAVVDDLATRGWSEQANFLPADLVRALATECRRRAAEGELNPAGVGRGAAQEVREAIRGDHILWLDPGESDDCDQYLDAMDELRLAINQGCSSVLRTTSATSPCIHQGLLPPAPGSLP